MSSLDEHAAIQIYEWYADIERRLLEIVRVLPFVEHAELANIHSPRLASILLEAASLVDALLRDQLPSKFTRPNGKNCSREKANIRDYLNELNPTLRLSKSQSLLLIGIPTLLSPFAPWDNKTVPQLPWWRAYNALKHDRLTSSPDVTLAYCLDATCALNQMMMKLPWILKLSFRFGWTQTGGYNPQIAIEDVLIPKTMGYIAYTEFFATFLCPVAHRTVDDIRPVMFRNGERLQSHLGRLGTKADNR